MDNANYSLCGTSAVLKTAMIECGDKIGNTLKLVPSLPTNGGHQFPVREVLAFILTDEPKKSALTPTQSASANNAAEAFVIDTSWDSATSNTPPDPSDALW